MTRQTFKIKGMHCNSCAMAIDMDLEDLPGVMEAKTSFAKATTEVVFDERTVSLDKIVGAIKESGYEAHPVPG